MGVSVQGYTFTHTHHVHYTITPPIHIRLQLPGTIKKVANVSNFDKIEW